MSDPSTTVGGFEIVHGGNQDESWVHVYSAHKLYTPRKINNVYFDGTKDIHISASDIGISYKTLDLSLQALPDNNISIFDDTVLTNAIASYDEPGVIKPGLLRSYCIPQNNPDYDFLHDRCFIKDLSYLICGLVSNEKQELAETYLGGLLSCYLPDGSIPYAVSVLTGLIDVAVPPAVATDRCFRTESSILAAYTLAYFKSKYPGSSLSATVDAKLTLALAALEVFYDGTANAFKQGKGKYSPTYSTFDPDFGYTDHICTDNIFAYYLYSLVGDSAKVASLQTTLITSFFDVDTKQFKDSLETTTLNASTIALGSLYLKSVANSNALHVLGLAESYYSIIKDDECTAQAAGYKDTTDSINISFYATIYTALSRFSFKQYNRALADMVSIANMYTESTGAVEYNKENLASSEYVLPCLASIGLTFLLVKPNGFLNLSFNFDLSGGEDAVHIHNVEEIRGIGSALADVESSITALASSVASSITTINGSISTVDGRVTSLTTELHNNYYTKDLVYTKVEDDALLAKKAPLGYYINLDMPNCYAGQILAAGPLGYVLADCKSLSTMQGLAYAIFDSVDGVVYASMYGDAHMVDGIVGSVLYLEYNGNYTYTPTEYGDEWVKAIGVVVATNRLILNFDSIAAKVYMLPDFSNTNPINYAPL